MNRTARKYKFNIPMKDLLLPGSFCLFLFITVFPGCNDINDKMEVQSSVLLSIDSIVATDQNIKVWEEITITAFAKGKNLSFLWSTNHGSMMGEVTGTVIYWGCPSCVGLNTVKCAVSNEQGTVSDTIMIQVNP